ncbi:MAG: protein-L-isoaspartate(D-aspartate) O-methyltransferase [Planctomyces sp.]|nr:protein-L-isoaspartate(D-aspartate) O-methyltransferase [Planctomyces sp.]
MRCLRPLPPVLASAIVASALLVLCCDDARAQARDQYSASRNKMVDDLIAAEGITDERVLASLRATQRHLFVRPAMRPMAYLDQALDIGHRQTISPPFIVAYMTEVLDPQPEDRVLEIGTGSGYQAAVLSPLVANVYTIEIVEPLGKRAETLLKSLKYDNVHVKVGDGYQGWPEHAPFDKIIVTCSPENVPEPLVAQLREGGRMVIPLGERYQQVFYLLEKRDGQLEQTRLLPTLFVPMTGRAEDARSVLPDPLNPRLVNTGFEEDEDENGQADGWHYHRRATLDDSIAYTGSRSLRFENDTPSRAAHVLQGFPIDGSKVRSLEVRAAHRQRNIRAGGQKGEQPGIVIHYFDAQRLPIAQTAIGPWMTTQDQWQATTKTVNVPTQAREAIIQLGLNGAAGVLWTDDVTVRALP